MLPAIMVIEALGIEFGLFDLSLSQAAGIYAILSVAPIYNATLPFVIIVSGYLSRVYLQRNPNHQRRIWIPVSILEFVVVIYFLFYLYLRSLAIEKVI
ncbi:hypothetical protein [Leptospira tipperaryensis]|uniref:hypothetical protein n=1 Tax=Leptospira tipperaryensis TaxID=2564040 RepID=UPI0012E9F5E8|nr:hypothetical protein [Leptospira tipperaryensis]